MSFKFNLFDFLIIFIQKYNKNKNKNKNIIKNKK